MGGDSFQGTKKLTNQQYQQMTQQLIQRLDPICKRIEPYIPLPEKQLHGDVDFLLILKQQFPAITVIQQLKMEKYKINNNNTINSVYKNKQVDFCIVKNDKQFQLASFYKSYSGIGAFLGMLLPSKQIKITTQGIYALGFHQHLKLQFLLCDQIDKMLEFYGLDYKRYTEGFKTRKQLFQYLRNVRFFDQQRFAYYQHKAPTKLTKFFSQYLKQTGIIDQKKAIIFQNTLEQTIQYFKKTQQYKKAFKDLIDSKNRQKQLNQKFNATHLLKYFDIKPKEINQWKKKFNQIKFNNNEGEYYNFVEKNQLEQILKEFQLQCNLKVKEQLKQHKEIADVKGEQLNVKGEQ